MIGTTFCEKHDWHNILGKNMIGSTFWKKPRLSAQSGVKKNMNDSKFWEKHD
jgi:hypothetical protein